MELKELKDSSGTKIRKYLMIDAYDTWWSMGISFLCRVVDMMHMGYVDEVIFGKEVVVRVPKLVLEWIDIHNERDHDQQG